MSSRRQTPSYKELTPASGTASRAARGASRKRDTRPERLLRSALWARGLRYRVDVKGLPGRPDVVFARERLAVFCDGDFWHGRQLSLRLQKLSGGHNASYWIRKISTNVDRDRRHDAALEAAGWRVCRLWETDVVADPDGAAAVVGALLRFEDADKVPWHEDW